MNMKTAAPDSALLLPDDTQNPDANDSTMTIAQKKLAIEGALTPYLTDDNLMQALRIWEEKYALQPTFALQRFLNEFCDSATLKAQRSQILQSLIRALSGADGKPLDTSRRPERGTAAPATAAPVVAASNSAVQCCTQLVEAVFARTPGDMHVKMRLFILQSLPGMKLPQMAQRAVHAWLSQQYRIPADVSIEEKALRHLVNLAYISLCEFLGPVKADQILHEAVVATERTVRDFPVRQLL